MSTKASPPTSSATASTNAAAATTAGGVVKIKSELLPSDEIKEYAENTMNELLGWYGFDGVDRLDLSSKNSRLLQSSNNANTLSHHQMEKRRSRNRATTLLSMQQQNLRSNNINNNNSNNNNNINNNNNNNNNNSNNNIKNNNNNNNNYSNNRNSSSKNNIRNNNSISNTNTFLGPGTTGCGGNESTTSDHDTRSSREDDSKSPHSAGRTTIDEKIDYDNCCWCRRLIPENAPEFLTTSDGPRYCSESCFTQSRRASFKKAKTCDWCKHVRHAVSYVDFQDGASQLQFCSDKCLNQYKMQIFCKETQAHLDMNPHLREQGLEAAASGNSAGLITPDLWLRNCRSRSASPASTISISPGPSAALSAISVSMSRPSPTSLSQTAEHRPLISVAPVSKLMSKSPVIMSNRQSPKHSRKKRPSRSNVGSSEGSSSMKLSHGSLRRELSNLGTICPSQLLTNTKSLLGVSKTNSLRTSPGQTSSANTSSSVKLPPAPSLSQFAASSIPELHMNVPPLSPMLDHQPLPHHQHPSLAPHPSVGGRGTSIPTGFFAPQPGAHQQAALPHQPPPLGPGFPTRPPFMQNPALGGLPRFMSFAGFPPMPHLMQPDAGGFPSLLGVAPPVTVMVPYPIIIPLPIPIPVPLPVIDFYRAHLTPAQREKLKQEEMQKSDRSLKTTQQMEYRAEELPGENHTSEPSNEPLDFTKSRESPPSIAQSLPEESKAIHDSSASAEFIDQPRSCANTPTENINSPPTESQVTHCIVPSESASEENENQPHSPSPTNQEEESHSPTCDDAKEKLPKFKITRLHTKRTLIQTKESECSRPLRKRKRIIDCDFQKIALSNKDGEQDEEPDNVVANTANACNNLVKSSSKK